MLCRVEMPANEQIYGRFYRYKLLHLPAGGSRFSVILLPVVLAGMLLMLGSFGVPPLVVAVLLAAMLGYYYYLLFAKPAAQFRARPGAALQTEVTILTETGLNRVVRSEEEAGQDSSSMQYVALVRAVETKSDFFLFTSPSQAILLDKQYFTNGTPAQLRAVLQKQMGARFTTKQREGA